MRKNVSSLHWTSSLICLALVACGTNEDGDVVGSATPTTTTAEAVTSCTVAPGSQIGTFTDPVTVTPIVPPNPPGISLKDTSGALVNAHGGGIIKVCDTFYLHGDRQQLQRLFDVLVEEPLDLEERGDHPAATVERPAGAEPKGREAAHHQVPGHRRVRIARARGRHDLSGRQGGRLRDLPHRERPVRLQRISDQFQRNDG